MEITFLTFNYGTAGRYVNGPGMCLHNLVTYLKNVGFKVNIFSILDSPYPEVTRASSINEIRKAIDRSAIVHHWSGLERSFASLCSYAKRNGKTVYIGPNLFDGVYPEQETDYLKKSMFDLILMVNQRLLFRAHKMHNIPLEKLKVFQVGPNTNLWAPLPEEKREDFILWKGNGKQHVKDVKFALQLAKKLNGKYKFEFIGHPRPYDYNSHIERAKKAKLYICTSLSETMSLALAESWMSGVPSITHPKIYLHGENYLTGIITNKTIDSYASAIEEVMENNSLWRHLSEGAADWAAIHFCEGAIINNYRNLKDKG